MKTHVWCIMRTADAIVAWAVWTLAVNICFNIEIMFSFNLVLSLSGVPGKIEPGEEATAKPLTDKFT